MVQKTQDSGFSLIEEEKKRMLEAAKQKASRKEDKKKPKFQRKEQEKLDLSGVYDFFTMREKADELGRSIENSKLAQKAASVDFSKQIPKRPRYADADPQGTKLVEKELKPRRLDKIEDSPEKELVKANAVAQVEQQSIEELKDPVQQPIQKDRVKKNRPSPKSEFMEALTFFAPSIIGGLGGALFEGTEGAIAGAEAGTSLGESFRDYQLKKYETEKGKAKKDYTSFVDINKGTPVVKHEDGSFTDLSGNAVLPNSITQAVNFRQTRSIQQRKEETNSRNERFKKKLGFDMAKVSQLSDTQQQALSNSLEVLKTIDRMDELKQNVDTGVVSNALNSLLEVVDMAPAGYTELKATSNDSLAKYVKSISGAQVSEMEARRLGQIIPTTKDNDETFIRKLQTFRSIVNANKNSFVEAIKRGQPLRKIRGLEEAASGLNIRLMTDDEIRQDQSRSLIEQYKNEKDPRKRLELGRKIKAMRNR